MQSQRMPAVLMTLTAAAFAVWSVILILSPGGPTVLEWVILGVAISILVFGLVSLRMDDPRRATMIRWLLTAFALFGAVVVIGLTADNSSSITWVRLGWAALIAGVITSLLAWWGAPRINRRSVVAGGVVAVVLIAAGASITLNCDEALQRSWCDPVFEQENCQIDAKVEEIPAGNLLTLIVSCASSG